MAAVALDLPDRALVACDSHVALLLVRTRDLVSNVAVHDGHRRRQVIQSLLLMEPLLLVLPLAGRDRGRGRAAAAERVGAAGVAGAAAAAVEAGCDVVVVVALVQDVARR